MKQRWKITVGFMSSSGWYDVRTYTIVRGNLYGWVGEALQGNEASLRSAS